MWMAYSIAFQRAVWHLLTLYGLIAAEGNWIDAPHDVIQGLDWQLRRPGVQLALRELSIASEGTWT
jgi:hypothetical protein